MKPPLASIVALGLLAQPLVNVAADTSPAHDQAPVASSSAALLSNFPLSLEVRLSEERGKIQSLVITHVQPGSDAHRAGLRPGDEIRAINRQVVQEIDATPSIEAKLTTLLLETDSAGESHLEVLTTRTKTVTLYSTAPEVRPSTNGRNIKRKSRPADPALELEPFRVTGNPFTSFPVELEVAISKETRVITAIVISDVLPSEEATRADLQAGDKILKLNGRPIGEAAGAIQHSVELNELLVNRPIGEKLEIEVLSQRIRPIALRVGAYSGLPPTGDKPENITHVAR